MNRENRPAVTDEVVEFEKVVEVQDLKKITDRFREIYGIYFKLIKKRRKGHNM
jgi:hypothetical protein